jgi:hypothetical protein
MKKRKIVGYWEDDRHVLLSKMQRDMLERIHKEGKESHGGKREGAGRKISPLPVRTKKFRAYHKDWDEFLSYLTGDAQIDFEIVLLALRMSNEITKGKNDQ